MINRVILVGRLVRDPEMRTFGKGENKSAVTDFTIAVDNIIKGKGNDTSFFNCNIWGKQAESVAKFARKGLLVGLDGTLVQRSYDKKDGTKASIVEIRCDSLSFLEPKKAENEYDPNTGEEKVPETHHIQEADNDEIAVDVPDADLPF